MLEESPQTQWFPSIFVYLSTTVLSVQCAILGYIVQSYDDLWSNLFNVNFLKLHLLLYVHVEYALSLPLLYLRVCDPVGSIIGKYTEDLRIQWNQSCLLAHAHSEFSFHAPPPPPSLTSSYNSFFQIGTRAFKQVLYSVSKSLWQLAPKIIFLY